MNSNLIAGLLFAAVMVGSRVVMRYALRRRILDQPNQRSSHTVPVPRLGGAAFVPLLLSALGCVWLVPWKPDAPIVALMLGICVVFTVSVFDDVFSLPIWVRFGGQLLASGGFVVSAVAANGAWLEHYYSGLNSFTVQAAEMDWGVKSFLLMLLTVWLVGSVNIYNFMDGIDGIAGVQAVIAGLAWWWWGQWSGSAMASALGLLSAAAAAGFLTINWPPAKMFMGDAGSTVLGFLLAAAPVLAAVQSRVAFDRLLIAAALALWPFLVDGTFTILRRLGRRENILQAHRSHLYQRLVIAGQTHRRVTLVYGALAAAGVGFGTLVVRGVPGAVPLAIGGVGVCFLCLWRWVCRVEERVGAVGRSTR